MNVQKYALWIGIILSFGLSSPASARSQATDDALVTALNAPRLSYLFLEPTETIKELRERYQDIDNRFPLLHKLAAKVNADGYSADYVENLFADFLRESEFRASHVSLDGIEAIASAARRIEYKTSDGLVAFYAAIARQANLYANDLLFSLLFLQVPDLQRISSGTTYRDFDNRSVFTVSDYNSILAFALVARLPTSEYIRVATQLRRNMNSVMNDVRAGDYDEEKAQIVLPMEDIILTMAVTADRAATVAYCSARIQTAATTLYLRLNNLPQGGPRPWHELRNCRSILALFMTDAEYTQLKTNIEEHWRQERYCNYQNRMDIQSNAQNIIRTLDRARGVETDLTHWPFVGSHTDYFPAPCN